jgi:ABC-type branched-subunit amino acid transport system substrate-binding protein
MACIAGPAGDEVATLLRKAVISSGDAVDVVATAMVATDGSNVAAAADQIVRSRPQAVILFLIGAAAIELIRSLTRAGAFPNYFGMSVVACDAVAKALGSELRGLTSCQIVPYPWSKSDPTARQFQQLCSARDLPVNYYTYEGYLNALFLIDVLQRTGGDVGRQTLQRTLRSYRGKIGGMDLDFTGGASTGGHFVELVHVRPDGSFVR